MLGTVAHPEGITNPPIDDLLEKVDSKYGLVIDAAKRARQINTYSQQLESNQLEVSVRWLRFLLTKAPRHCPA